MTQYRWLLAAARRDAPDDVEPPDLEGATLPEAWARTAAAYGLPPDRLAERVAEAHGLRAVRHVTPEPEALALLPGHWATEHLVLPLEVDDERFLAGVADPRDLDLEETLRFITGRPPAFVVVPPERLREELLGHYDPDEATADIAEHLDVQTQVRQLARATPSYDISAEDLEGGPIIKLANRILADAIRGRASDVHLGFGEDQGVVRYRIDGVMRTVMAIPAPVMLRAISRIKVIGGLNVGDKLRPQDGRCRVKVDDHTYDLRISTVPTRGTEKAVLRILDPSAAPDLESVGLQAPELAAFRRLLGNREGIVVVTGPTGSGKTTTLYAALRHLATDDVNVMTVEDPIEYEVAGLTQIQVNTKQNVTFASALRAVLRQDPDIVLVGEIRDLETAQIAVQAGLTGHLVLTTLHTNDAIGSIRRLSDLGLDRPAIAESLKGIVAQRLVRRLCPSCQAPADAGPRADDAATEDGEITPCEHCGGTGYQGRAPVNEVVPITRQLRELIVANASPAALYEAAAAAGARPLLAAGEDLVAQGITSPEELDRVLGTDAENGADAPPPPVAPISPSAPTPPAAGKPVPAPPASAPDARPPAAPEPTPTAAAAGARKPSPDAAGAPRILVVEDDNVARTMICKTLRKNGYAVADAREGLQAMEMLRSNESFDLVITDLDMPEMSGRALLSQLRGAHSTIPLIVLTGSSNPDSEAGLLISGADDYLRKPVRPALFLARVALALRRHARTA